MGFVYGIETDTGYWILDIRYLLLVDTGYEWHVEADDAVCLVKIYKIVYYK